MVYMNEIQKKLDNLPLFFRSSIRGGFIFITWLPIFFSDIIAILLALGHASIVSILLYNNLDLRTEPDQTWESYRRSLILELLMCVIIIVISMI